jgi:predicted CoA-substrate-specific enzyme activase
VNKYQLGIDIGSTTAKVIVTDESGQIIYSNYIRHNTRITETLLNLVTEISSALGDIYIQPAFSGSAAMGIAESTNTPFVQEIIAAAFLVNKRYPGVKSLIDIGGEDAKLVLFNDMRNPDIRMNGNCAGGTGAYIDQMASLLNISISQLNDLAWQSSKIYPIASRCGVFAKTDVQNLISRKISTADIAASIFEAIAGQTINTLARGCTIEPEILFCGGPLTYISYLRESFSRLLNIDKSGIIVPEHAELFTAYGTALSVNSAQKPIKISEFTELIRNSHKIKSENNTLDAFFYDDIESQSWANNRNIIKIPERAVKDKDVCFLGIDSGSTTTKIVITDTEGCLLYHFYKNNNGHPLETVIDGLKKFNEQLLKDNLSVTIGKTAVTGYGEELIKSALGIDYGIVETVAHFVAAKYIEPNVSFILDIGGQDMKAIYVQNSTITNIEINEACSSGCGSFIEGFANTLGYTPVDFASLAFQSKAPYNLGSRCTVFMNSKVKQALRDGATVADLSAGLAYSVIKNCLNKVLRIKSSADIGDNIVVQGGTFRNVAVFRSLEILSGKKIVVSDKPELMGAYGVALYAKRKSEIEERLSSFIGLQNLDKAVDYNVKLSTCKGCTNNCQITTYKFSNGGVCFSGNKCEKIFTNNSTPVTHGQNIFDYKRQLIFNREEKNQHTDIRIGIPRILNMYENYPFWHSLFTNCGLGVVLSDESSHGLYKKGIGELMSDNICFPAKLAHGHIANLVEKQVDRIFFPFVVYEKKEFSKSSNSYNCPIITGYSEVLKSSASLMQSASIPFDSPSINFDNSKLLKKACWNYCKSLGISASVFGKAFDTALSVQIEFKTQIKEKNIEIRTNAIKSKTPLILVASHPYHMDHLIHQQVSQMLSDLGVSVINEEIAVGENNEGFESFYAVSQWEYPNRIIQAAWWVAQQKSDIGLIQLNSFGCGPDSFIMDEISDLTKRAGTTYALIRIDEISSPGSIKLRLRSLVESLKLKAKESTLNTGSIDSISEHAIFAESDRNKTILVPWFSDFYSPFIPILGKHAGYTIKNIPPSNIESVNLGLEYANNEICYPATLVVGDIINVLRSNKYNLEDIAIGITQTGGQCRASNYIALIKRAMKNAGFANIPVVAIGDSNDLSNQQPGFTPAWLKILKPAFMSLLFADSLSRMYYATVCREKIKGSSLTLKEAYLKKATELVDTKAHNKLLSLLNAAVRDFNAIQTESTEVQTVGIVGEIYIKYNAYGQFNIIDWLINNRVEVVVPPLMEFFMQSFVNSKARQDENISQTGIFSFITNVLEWYANHHLDKFEKALESFRFYRPSHNISHSAHLAKEILSLNNQYGEGWLIPAEIAALSLQNIHNVICIQPFGCIANHIVGKGMENKIKKRYPDTNLLFLDFDYGTSKVNILNRLHFMLQQKSVEYKELAN